MGLGPLPRPGADAQGPGQQGFRTVSIVDPGVKHDPGYEVYDDGLAQDVFCRTEGGDTYIGQVWPGNTVFPDFATPEARAWWGALNARHVESGLAGIWNDMNEPATGEIPPEAMLFDRGRAKHERYHNQYALLMAMGTLEGLRARTPDARTFILSRAGFAGIQRYAANWMGDNQARWDHLWVSMPMACGFGLSGQPFVGADIGGFQGDTNPELFLRWMQIGHADSLLPQPLRDRRHRAVPVGVRPRDPRPRPRGGAAALPAPALHLLGVRAGDGDGRAGAAAARPRLPGRPGRASTSTTSSCFGRDLLVAPVTEPGMTVAHGLPPGRRTGTTGTPASCTTGGQRITVERRSSASRSSPGPARRSRCGPRRRVDRRLPPRVIELHVFDPAVDGRWESLLVEDDGLTVAEGDPERLTTTVVVSPRGREVSVEHETSGPGMPVTRAPASRSCGTRAERPSQGSPTRRGGTPVRRARLDGQGNHESLRGLGGRRGATVGHSEDDPSTSTRGRSGRSGAALTTTIDARLARQPGAAVTPRRPRRGAGRVSQVCQVTLVVVTVAVRLR